MDAARDDDDDDDDVERDADETSSSRSYADERIIAVAVLARVPDVSARATFRLVSRAWYFAEADAAALPRRVIFPANAFSTARLLNPCWRTQVNRVLWLTSHAGFPEALSGGRARELLESALDRSGDFFCAYAAGAFARSLPHVVPRHSPDLIRDLSTRELTDRFVPPRVIHVSYRIVSHIGAGKLHLLKWLRGEGYPWGYACSQAAAAGHLHVLKWAHQRGAPLNDWNCYYARLHGHIDVLKYLYDVGAPNASDFKHYVEAGSTTLGWPPPPEDEDDDDDEARRRASGSQG